MSWTPKYTHRQRVLVLRLYGETHSVSVAATEAGVGRSWAYKVLRRAGAIESHPPVFTAKLAREAVDLYVTGLSCRQVTEILAVNHDPCPSQQWVWTRVRQAKVARSKSRAMEVRETRRRGKNFDEVRAVARRLAAERLWSVKRIAAHLRVTTKTIARALPPHLKLKHSAAMDRRYWQAYLPDVEKRRALRDEVVDRRRRGQSYPQICKATSLGSSTVYLYLRAASLTTPCPRRPLGSRQQRVLTIIIEAGARGITSRNLLKLAGLPKSHLSAYVGEFVSRGLAVTQRGGGGFRVTAMETS